MMNNPEYIVAIAEEQSLLKAAEKLFVTPSALSQYVSKLESQLSTPLFTRSRAGWSPTTAGLLYIDLAKNVIALERQTYTQISTVTSSFPCTISIGISPGRMVDMMASCFPAFNARFPNIKLVLREAPVSDTIRQMRQQKTDIGFITTSSESSQPEEIDLRLLRNEGFVLALPHTHPLASTAPAQIPSPSVPLDHFRDCEFMLLQPGTTLREAQDLLFEHAGFTPNVIFESANSQTIHSLVQVGYAAALIPASYAVPSGSSVYFPVKDSLRWNLYAAHHIHHRLSASEEYIVNLASAYCKGG